MLREWFIVNKGETCLYNKNTQRSHCSKYRLIGMEVLYA